MGDQPNDALLSSELQSPRITHNDLPNLDLDLDLATALDEASQERDALRIDLLVAEDSLFEEKSEPETDIELSKTRAPELFDERPRRDRSISEALDSIRLARECLTRVSERIGEEKREEEPDVEDEVETLLSESQAVYKLGMAVELKVAECEEMRRKERKELENSIVSLTEENRDMGSLLRAALADKEAVERSLSRLKGSGDQKRVAILQIAERGLQRVGFGFMMGATAGGAHSDQPGSSNASTRSEGSEDEEEINSLSSTVEKIMKNLRLEVTNLKQSLEESRSDCERLQNLVDEQAQKITESTLYIKELEERENMLAHNVEELMMETTEAGEEVARWREACELEVEAGKSAIEECEKEVAILKEELERTKSALDESNSKLKLKEKLAATAMAAQAAAEASLQMADRRSAGFRERIEELMRQVEEEADRGSGSGRRERSGGRRRVRHMCWPWRALKLVPSASVGVAAAALRGGNRRRMPEMEALLHFRI